jgi:hypothetical protein
MTMMNIITIITITTTIMASTAIAESVMTMSTE